MGVPALDIGLLCCPDSRKKEKIQRIKSVYTYIYIYIYMVCFTRSIYDSSSIESAQKQSLFKTHLPLTPQPSHVLFKSSRFTGIFFIFARIKIRLINDRLGFRLACFSHMLSPAPHNMSQAHARRHFEQIRTSNTTWDGDAHALVPSFYKENEHCYYY